MELELQSTRSLSLSHTLYKRVKQDTHPCKCNQVQPLLTANTVPVILPVRLHTTPPKPSRLLFTRPSLLDGVILVNLTPTWPLHNRSKRRIMLLATRSNRPHCQPETRESGGSIRQLEHGAYFVNQWYFSCSLLFIAIRFIGLLLCSLLLSALATICYYLLLSALCYICY